MPRASLVTKPYNALLAAPAGGLASRTGRFFLDEAASNGVTTAGNSGDGGSAGGTAPAGSVQQSAQQNPQTQGVATQNAGTTQQAAPPVTQQPAPAAVQQGAARLETAMQAALAPMQQALDGFQQTMTSLQQSLAQQPAPQGQQQGQAPQGQQQQQGQVRNPAPFTAREGESIMSSRGYSMQRLFRAMNPNDSLGPEHAKIEVELGQRLRQCYGGAEGPGSHGGVLVPLSSRHIQMTAEVAGHQSSQSLAQECRQLMRAGFDGATLQQAWEAFQHEVRGTRFERQALNMFDDTAGGQLLGETQMGDLIELLTPREVMNGCLDMTLGPNGQLRVPRDTADVTGGYVGMGAAGDSTRAGTESSPSQDHLMLSSKKQWFISRIPNELIRFPTMSAELWVRNSIVRSSATLSNSTFISGLGGMLVPKGFIRYSNINTIVASTVGTNGNTVQPQDIDEFGSIIEEQNIDEMDAASIVLIMRPTLFTKLANRRADAVSAADKAGPFVFLDANLQGSAGPRNTLRGMSVRKSTHVPNDRVKGSGSDLTMILALCLQQYVHARQGVFEMLASNVANGAFERDETVIRGYQYHDMAPLREEAHALMDVLLTA